MFLFTIPSSIKAGIYTKESILILEAVYTLMQTSMHVFAHNHTHGPWSFFNQRHRNYLRQSKKYHWYDVLIQRNQIRTLTAHAHTQTHTQKKKNQLKQSTYPIRTEFLHSFIHSFIDCQVLGPGGPFSNQKIPGKSTFCSWPYFNYLADALLYPSVPARFSFTSW